MQLLFDQGNNINPFSLINVSVKKHYFSAILDSWIYALSEHPELCDDLILLAEGDLNYNDAKDLGKSICHRFIDFAYNDSYFLSRFFSNYIAQGKQLCPEIFNELNCNLMSEIFYNLISDDDDLAILRPKINSKHYIYNHNARLQIQLIKSDEILLLPLFYFSNLPFYPWSMPEKLHNDLHLILRKNDPLLLKDLQNKLKKHQEIYVNDNYLYFVCLNDEYLLLVENNGNLYVDIGDEIFRNYFSIPYFLKKSEYIKTKYSSYIGSAMKVDINAEYLKKYFEKYEDKRFINNVNYKEVGIKLSIINEKQCEYAQNIPRVLHDEIVNLLLKNKKAISYKYICRHFHVNDFPIFPDRLPFGRICAYGKSKRFINKNNATYVLRDWVESKDKKKAMILKERILSPLKIKAIKFDVSHLEQALSSEPLKEFGIYNSTSISKHIAQHLPNKPTEPYYITKIQGNVELYLSSKYMDLGKGFFITIENYIDRDDDMTASKWRRLIVENIFFNKSNILEIIKNLPNNQRMEFEELIR